jgi:hypothetical protein
MTKGIVNPFFDPPPKVNPRNIPIQQQGATKLEAPLPTDTPNKFIDLDGDSYILRFKRANDISEITEHLIGLLYAIKVEYEYTLATDGIYFKEQSQTWMLKDSKDRALFVAVPEEATELDVYRRLGYALGKLRSCTQPILKKFGIQIIERG